MGHFGQWLKNAWQISLLKWYAAFAYIEFTRIQANKADYQKCVFTEGTSANQRLRNA